MERKLAAFLVPAGLAVALLVTACGSDQSDVDLKAVLAQPKTYVTSERCKTCHLEHYDSWKMTLHSRMLQDVRRNPDALVTAIDPAVIKADLTKIEGKLKLPVDQIYIPKPSEIRYTIGNQWKQRFLVERDGKLYISPVQYNIDTDRWVNYHEKDWLKRPWLLKCGGCHATGVNLAENNFSEPAVGCEACHGPGSQHVALPKTAVFAKRQTIINPAKLPAGTAAQVCGSCHNRGKATRHKGAGWPVGYRPGRALGPYYKSTSYEGGDKKHMYANEFSKGHQQQYIDWRQSRHFKEGVTCTSCHYVHRLGMPSNQFQTKGSGSQQCFQCHTMVNNNLAHSIHSFANCVGCHMPRIAKSAESGDIHSHVFITLLPQDTMNNPAIPNSCQACHRHKNDDLQKLQKRFEELARLPKPRGKVVEGRYVPTPTSAAK